MSDTRKNDGGPAFPGGEKWTSTDLSGNTSYHAKAAHTPGMTLRDWFAGQAIAGMSAHPANETALDVALWAGKVADAMIAGRAK